MISCDDVCCSVVFGTLVGMLVCSVMWSELLMPFVISCALWSSVYGVPESGVYVHTPVRSKCGMFVMYCMQCCMPVSAVLLCVDVLLSRRYINICNCDIVNVCLDHLKFCVVCIDGRRYVCCSECNVVSNKCNEPTSCLVQPIGTRGGDVMFFGCVCFRGELGFLNCVTCVSAERV